MGDVIKHSTLDSWISTLNTVRANLSLTQYSTTSAAGQIAKAEAITNYLASINSLRNNTYGAYGVYAISNPEKVLADTVINDDIHTKINSTLNDLLTICANDLTGLSATSGFSLEGVTTTFSRTSFSRILDAGFTNKSNFSDNSNYSPDNGCAFFSDNCSDTGYTAEFDCGSDWSDFTDNVGNCNRDTIFSTNAGSDSTFFNVPFSNMIGDCSQESRCFQFARFSDFSADFARFSGNFDVDTCVTNSNCTTFTQDATNTNFDTDSVCNNTCAVTNTMNTLTPIFAGFAVRT